MALRPSKITSDILQTCNKYLINNAEVALRSLSSISQNEPITEPTPYRYRISNTQKPQDLPAINFENSTTVFAELQPSANPEFKFENMPPRWAEKSEDNSPFPAFINSRNRTHVTYTDQQKAEDKMLKYKMVSFNPMTRNMSTGFVRCYSKGPAENSGSSGSCKKKGLKCFKQKSKDCKLGANRHCPKLKLLDCAQSKGSDCKLNYLDPNCSKKFAPYPSYSESCAENLPDDPSECQQCPWRTCDGADTIEPGKPVRNRRNYSTSCSRHLEATAGVVIGPLIPPVSEVQLHLGKGKCGQTKSPCKQPPGPCEVRRQKEQEKKREKEIHIPPKPKKASDDMNRMVLTNVEGDSALMNLNGLDSLNFVMDQPMIENKSSWIDIVTAEDMYLDDKKNKWPKCHKKKKPKRPDEGFVDVAANIMRLDKKKIKGDEGHPPPCDDHKSESLKCPKKPIKKPKYKKRPMNTGFYKKPEEPYTPT